MRVFHQLGRGKHSPPNEPEAGSGVVMPARGAKRAPTGRTRLMARGTLMPLLGVTAVRVPVSHKLVKCGKIMVGSVALRCIAMPF